MALNINITIKNICTQKHYNGTTLLCIYKIHTQLNTYNSQYNVNQLCTKKNF